MPATKLTAFSQGAIGNIYRVSIDGVGPDGDHVNTFFLRQVAAAPSGNIFEDIGASWNAVNRTSYLACFPDTYALEALRIAQVDDLLKGLPSQAITTSGAGTRIATGDRLPGQCAALLEFNTGFSGRKLRGRNYFGVLHEGDQADGLVATALRELLEDYAQTLLDTWVVGNAVAEWVAFARLSNEVALIQSFRAKLPVYTQRRRRAGVGS